MSAPATTTTTTLFVESRARRGSDGGLTTDDAGLAGRDWQDELHERSGLRLAMRVEDRHPDAGGPTIDGEVVALPHYVGLRAMLRRLPALVRGIDRAVQESEVVVVKLPGIIGLIATACARYRKRPLAVQVVGDIAEVLRAGVAGRGGAQLATTAAWATRWAVRQGDAVRYVTRHVLQERYPPREDALVVVYSDVRVDERPVREPRTFVPGRLIAVGSQEQLYKGHQTLIEAVGRIASVSPHVHLLLVGAGRCQPQLRSLAEARGVADRVQFLGHIGDRASLLELLDGSDVFAMPSLTEGMPRALIEAMARGLPCVGSRVGGIPELLPSPAMAPPGDAAALAELLTRALSDEEFRARLVRSAHEALERFRPAELESSRRAWSRALEDVSLRSGAVS